MNLDLLSDNLTSICMVANTPSYLYRRLRAEPSVEAFAKTANATQLLQFLHAAALARDRTLEDQCKAYAVLVALSYKPFAEVRQALDEQGLPKIRWARQIIETIRATDIPTTIIREQVSVPQPKVISPGQVRRSGASHEINVFGPDND